MKILFFAALREALATEHLEWPDTADLTVGTLRQQLAAHSPQWCQAFAMYGQMCAVDQQLADDKTRLDNANEVAFFPMVTGG